MKIVGYKVHKAIKEIEILQGGIDSNSGMYFESFTYRIPYCKENIQQLKSLGVEEVKQICLPLRTNMKVLLKDLALQFVRNGLVILKLVQ